MDQKISTGYLKILLRYILASSKLKKKKNIDISDKTVQINYIRSVFTSWKKKQTATNLDKKAKDEQQMKFSIKDVFSKCKKIHR